MPPKICFAARAAHSDLNFPFIRFAKKSRAAEIAEFDAVHVRDDHVAETEQREIFDDLIAQRPRADDEHACAREQRLVPPFDGFQPREAAFRKLHRCSPWRKAKLQPWIQCVRRSF